MITIETKRFLFSKKMIWFNESPFDVTDCDAVFFFACKNNVDFPGFEKREELSGPNTNMFGMIKMNDKNVLKK